MNENKLAIIHALITGTIGFAFLALFFAREPIKIVLALLIYPLGYATIKLFMKTGIKNAFVGFLVGGVFANISYWILIVILSSFLERSLLSSTRMAILWGFIIFFVFIVGGIAGMIITLRMRKIDKRKPSKQEHAQVEIYY